MVYGIMQRTNIYLSEVQLESLRRLSEQRGEPVAELVRRALDEWLRSQGVRVLEDDEWERRFQALMGRRRDIASSGDFSPEAVDLDVTRAVREVRRRLLLLGTACPKRGTGAGGGNNRLVQAQQGAGGAAD